jgi:CRP/FNR family transcriptional regulator, cyclic AMP receptor protein
MSVAASASTKLCHVLEEDRDLAESVPPDVREQAARECLARELSIPAGRWTGSEVLSAEDGIGLLVLSGLLIRRVGIEARFGAELLGEGDLLRPWQGEDDPPTLPVTTGWQVLEPTRMAVLDDAFARRMARYPALSGRLVGRAIQRSRNLSVNMAIVHQARVDVRLHMLFWHLAARWGKVRREDVSLPLRLTHTVLAELVAARRPTVTSALSDLARRELVRAADGGWALTGDPPGELLELASVPPSFISKRGSAHA